MPKITKPNDGEATIIVNKIYELAHRATLDLINAEAEESTSFDDLSDQVAWCIEGGHDDILSAAMTKAKVDGGRDVLEELEVACEYHASSIFKKNDTSGEVGELHLFAIPIVIAMPGRDCPFKLSSAYPFDLIADSIHECDIADQLSELHIVNYLYSANQLEGLCHGDVYRFANAIMIDSDSKSLNQKMQISEPKSLFKMDEQESLYKKMIGVELRYVVGVISMSSDDDSEFTFIADENEAHEDEASAMLIWQKKVAGILSQCMGINSTTDHLVVGLMDEFYAARRAGTIEYNNFELFIFLQSARQNLLEEEKYITVTAFPYRDQNDDVTIDISLRCKKENKEIATHKYKLSRSDDLEVAMDEVVEIIGRSGFIDIIIGSEMKLDAPFNEIKKSIKTTTFIEKNFPSVPFPQSTMIH